MPGASLALFADLGACHAKSQVLRFAFYPRPLGGGRHQGISQKSNRVSDFYPRPPGGGRHFIDCVAWRTTAISIHALRVEGDVLCPIDSGGGFANFYPRPPGGGRPLPHAAHQLILPYFYPRPPGGGRRFRFTRCFRRSSFLSTPSGWRATAKTDKVFVCFCAKGRRICLFKTRKEKICRWRFKKDKFWVLIWCEGSGKSVCALASHCG